MINKNKLILFLLFLIVIAVPIVSAGDNATLEVIGDDICSDNVNLTISDSDDDEILGAGEVYFDSSAASGGDGSKTRPYNTVTSSYLGSTNIFAAGTYRIASTLSSYTSYDGVSFIGNGKENTILEYTGSDAFITTANSLTLKDITIKGTIHTTGGTLTATDTIFDGGVGKIETESDNYKYGNSYGGAIKQSASGEFDWGSIFGGGSSSSQALNINNCIFTNNFAAYGGAIYSERGTVTITGSRFENNHAENGGGAISVLNGVSLTVTSSNFTDDYSLYDAGGAIYAFNVTSLNVRDSKFTNCRAAIGGAIGSLISPVTITGSSFYSNKANWTGGAVFSMYGRLTSSNSNYFENSAYHGGAIYADNLTDFELNGGRFEKNSAVHTAGAVFAFTNKANRITNPSYISNTASEYDDLYKSSRFSLDIGSSDYEMIQYNPSSISIPSKYDLRTLNQVTQVKDQGISGNCWAFATMATLESAILKATGKQVILSEGNLKNLANIYSDIGWRYETNGGGMYPFAFGYLTSWAGPVLYSHDPTDDLDVIAPIINSIVHVQNILFLQRTSFTDNDAIKRAIMNYGAVCSEIYWSSSYINGNNYYYSGSESRNHAISVVGWDDTRTISGAPGQGAWIIKNSYGSHRGDGGYYYVSYYDKSLFRVYDESYNSFAVVFNDTVRFNRNYQYDAAFTDYFLTPSMNKAVWYRNTFTSAGNDILSAFSTYFRKTTNWQAEVYVNGELKTTQTGRASPGYWTVNLDEEIPLRIGDNFTISLKIECTSSADIPISEYGAAYTMVKEYFKPGVSFFSTDGVTWTDFYGYKSTFGSGQTGHNYYNQVACLKAFTKEGPKVVLNTTIDIAGFNSTSVEVRVVDQNGGAVNTGEVEIVVDGTTFKAAVSKSLASFSIYLGPGSHSIQATYIQNQYYNSSTVSRSVDVGRETPVVVIIADNVSYGEVLEVEIRLTNAVGETVTQSFSADVNGVSYTQKRFNVSGLKPANYTITVNTIQNNDFSSAHASKTITVSKLTPSIDLQISDVLIDEKININAVMSNQINCTVKIMINGNAYNITLNNGYGSISVDSHLSAGSYIAYASFEGDEYFTKATSQRLFNVDKRSFSMELECGDIAYGENLTVIAFLPGDIEDDLTLSVSSKTYTARASNGRAVFTVPGLGIGNYTCTVDFKENNRYKSASSQDSFEVAEKPKRDVGLIVKADTVDNSVIVSVELPGDARGSVEFNFNSMKFTKTPVNGKTSFKINDLESGVYNYTVRFAGDSEYKSSFFMDSIIISKKSVLKSTISAVDMKRAYLSGVDFEATFTDLNGNPLNNREVLFIINGNEYYVTTNQYGIAALSNNFGLGDYEVGIFNPATGENITKSMTIVKRIAQYGDIVMDYADGTSFRVCVFADNGAVAGAGEEVTFRVDGKTFKVKTNSNGYASLKITLKPKTYTITAGYRGVTVSNKIIVKQVLKAKNISKKKAKKIRFTATLKSSSGKAIKGKKIVFKLKGKKYTVKTNKKGKATVTLKNLKVGRHKITSAYLGVVISNTIKIRK